MSFSIARVGDRVTVSIEGQLVAGNRAELRQLVRDQLSSDAKEFVIDFTRAGYLDSAGLGALVSASKEVRDDSGRLRLVNLNHDLRQLLELTRLDSFFGLEPDGPHAA